VSPAADLHRRPAEQLAADLQGGSLSARALLDHCLERIERLNPALNAIVALNPEAARAADDSDARLRAGRALGPLDGLPATVKDNLLMRGCPAIWGSPLFRDRAPAADELPVARLRAAGAVLVGKTNTPEFSLRGYTDNPVFGPTRNPWDPALTPGGSSGGAAAALAAGLAPLALATDGGGSIRRPAAHTGVVGVKPGAGRIPRAGGFPALMFDCEVAGAMARTVSGVRLMFEALATGRPAPTAGPARILVVERIGDAPVEPLIVERARQAGAQLAALGHKVTYGALPFPIDAAMAAWQALTPVGLARLAEGEPRFFELATEDFADQARAGQAVGATAYAAVIDTLMNLRAVTAQAFERIDVILTPAAAAQPWPIPLPYPLTIDGRAVGPRGHAVFTGWVNACGHPAIALPVRPADDGMPVGVQLVGAPGSDERLLDIAAAFEAAHPWADRWPQMA
jgi:aspartyl-tRNA(Asn)/glutamyl-tRNA(Gln) amidotransferase subunit A